MEAGPVKTLTAESPSRRSAINPWGTSPQTMTAPCSLSVVMDEELAKKVQKEEEGDHVTTQDPATSDDSSLDTSSDLLLAQMLQLEYDREHDRQLLTEEKHFNKHNKVKISFERYRSLPESYLDDGESDSEQDEDEEEWTAAGDSCRSPASSSGSRRRKGVSPGQPTKHDPVICGRRNVQNIEKFPPAFPAGDIVDAGDDFQLANHVFNTLREHSYREEKHAQRLHEKKEHSTQEHALDPKTRLMLFKMVDSGLLKAINGCVSTGKEAMVYHAVGGEREDGPSVPSECAVKVFKTTLNEFKNRDRYIKDDYRFRDRFGKQNPRKFVRLWAEKEMHNLKRLHGGGVACPEVVLLRKHILVMSFIGRDQKRAPTLKEAMLSREQMNSAYQQCLQGMERMYRGCHLIHADLSEYNMMWFEGRVYFIDVSQSIEPSHPNGLEFLVRDCRNVSSFFTKCGVSGVMTAYELFNHLTGLDITADNHEEFLVKVRTHTHRQQLMDTVHSKTQPYPFDYFFEETEKKRNKKKTSKQQEQTFSSSDETDDSSSDKDEPSDHRE